MIGAAIALAAVLQIVYGRRGRAVVPAEAFVLLLGIPLGLSMLVTPGAEPLGGEFVLAYALLWGLLLGRGRLQVTVRGLGLGLLVLLGIGGLILFDTRVAAVGLTAVLLLMWRWRPQILGRLTGLLALLLFFGAGLLVIRNALLPASIVRWGYALLATLVLAWETRRPLTQARN